MTGRAVDQPAAAPQPRARPADPFLSARRLSRFGEYRDVDLDLFGGEIVAVVGLLGSGRTELALTLFGAAVPNSGTIAVAGRPRRFRSVRDAMAAGIAYVPEDRLAEGLFLDQSIRDNIVVSSLSPERATGLARRPGARPAGAKAAAERLRIRLPRSTRRSCSSPAGTSSAWFWRAGSNAIRRSSS